MEQYLESRNADAKALQAKTFLVFIFMKERQEKRGKNTKIVGNILAISLTNGSVYFNTAINMSRFHRLAQESLRIGESCSRFRVTEKAPASTREIAYIKQNDVISLITYKARFNDQRLRLILETETAKRKFEACKLEK